MRMDWMSKRLKQELLPYLPRVQRDFSSACGGCSGRVGGYAWPPPQGVTRLRWASASARYRARYLIFQWMLFLVGGCVKVAAQASRGPYEVISRALLSLQERIVAPCGPPFPEIWCWI